MVFPADRSLSRPEDGVALLDGRLIVADQVHGLRLIERGGSSRPFGDLAGAGYAHDPPRRHGAPNGVSLEPDGKHLLVADVLGGEIYRVELASGATQRLYSHAYGVNSAVRDSTGAIWFTQSARNTEEQGEMGMFTPVDVPVAQGALWRLPFANGRLATEAVLVMDGLYYANGLAIDETRGTLFLCELAANRVLSFPLDVVTGELGPGATLLEMPTPDNIEQDSDGRLWVVSPIGNEVLVVDPDTGAAHSAFCHRSEAQAELADEWARRGAAGTPRLELLTPALFEPLPGILTGVLLGAPDGTIYLTGLGSALIRLEPAPRTSLQLEDFATRYAAAWSSQDPDELASFYAEAGSLTVNAGPTVTGRAAIAAKAREFMHAFPDMLVVMDSVEGEKGRARFHWTWTGTNTGPGGTGRSVRISGHEEWTFSPAGRIAESRGHYDEAEYERQMRGDRGE
jgi:sugar lactone lactonase YvrE